MGVGRDRVGLGLGIGLGSRARVGINLRMNLFTSASIFFLKSRIVEASLVPWAWALAFAFSIRSWTMRSKERDFKVSLTFAAIPTLTILGV